MKTSESAVGVQFKNILFATDLSPASEKALPYAIEIARRYESTIHAVHVIQPDLYPLVPPEVLSKLADVQAEFRRDSQCQLDEQLREITHEIILREGEIWPALAEVIRAKEIDLLVLNTQGESRLEKNQVGSVAEQIFHRAICPVLTVGPNAAAAPRYAAELNRIVFATDFSPESLAGAPYAISLAREHRAQLVLLHCLEGSGDVLALLHALRDIVPFGADLRCEPVCVVERGVPANKTLEVSEGHGADMIVLGASRTDRRIARFPYLTRTGISRIITDANCPVLTVRS